tara:strand:- start:101 stop:505 length:405 start_codon:yes stop_codon:yes gene_type:complete
MNFSLDVKKFAAKSNRNVSDVIVATSVDLFSTIITETPVDTGRLRANWQASLGSPITSKTETTDKTGGETKSKMISVINTFAGDGSLFLSNNLPYAYRIEFLGWSRLKAPKGMVRVSFRQVHSAMKKAIRKLSR